LLFVYMKLVVKGKNAKQQILCTINKL